MNIEDLTLNCAHGNRACLVLVAPDMLCHGGRAPTRQELIEVLDGRPVISMPALMRTTAFYLSNGDDEPDGFVVTP